MSFIFLLTDLQIVIVRNALNFIQHDRLSMEKSEGISREMETDGNIADASIQMLYCPDTEDSNHCASDTSGIKQGLLDLSILFYLFIYF